MMENLTQGFKLPCIMDVKIGARCPFSNVFSQSYIFPYKKSCIKWYSYQFHLILLPHYHLRTWGPDSSPEKRAAQDASYRFITCFNLYKLLLSYWYKLLVCYFLTCTSCLTNSLLPSYTFTNCQFVAFLYLYKLLVVFVTAGLKNHLASPSLGLPCTRERRSR